MALDLAQSPWVHCPWDAFRWGWAMSPARIHARTCPDPLPGGPGWKQFMLLLNQPATCPTRCYITWLMGALGGCEAAQDRLMSTYCQAFKCLCLVSILPSEASSLGLPHTGSSTNAFLQGALQLFALAEWWPFMCSYQGPGCKRGPHRACKAFADLQSVLREQQ